jgi:hypothetical protein
MQQALSVLCNNVQPREGVRDNRHLTPKSHSTIYQQTIDALRERLAQPKTPDVTPEVTPHVIDCPRCGHCCPQPNQEPVKDRLDFWALFDENQRLRAELKFNNTPQQRQWVGLTDEEIKSLPSWWPSYEDAPALVQLVKDVETKLREKNGG